jgi:hypothetical protein
VQRDWGGATAEESGRREPPSETTVADLLLDKEALKAIVPAKGWSLPA